MGGCVALVVAGGRGRRFGGPLPKQYCRLGGVPVIRHSLRAFLDHPRVDAVQPVIHPDDADLFAEAAEGLAVLRPVHGGATRQDSVLNGLEAAASLRPDAVLIHDAARPFVSEGVISRVLEALETQKGAIPAMPVADTLKRGADGLIAGTVDREGLWRAQTPQGFRFDAILAAHRAQKGAELTDDAAVLEAAGHAVALVLGSEENGKVTTTEDLDRAEAALVRETRVGTGFDVHAIERPGEGVTLCGVPITCGFRLKGHSDADVAMHAATDAILGAIAAGDIGSHFPPSDPQWKGAASEVFLRKAVDLMAERGGRLVNLDVTVICEEPKIGPHRAEMAGTMAKILGVDVDRVAVKGTTTEKLGFAGRGEGVAAQAVAAVEVPRR